MWIPEFQDPEPSFRLPLTDPGGEPDAEPTICIRVSAAWLPIVAGCLMQVVQPPSWKETDPVLLQDLIDRSTKLLNMFGESVPACCPAEPPYVPPGTAPEQAVCSISGYMANMIIRYAMDQAVQAVQQNLGILKLIVTVGQALAGIFPLTSIAISAFATLYTQIATGTLTDYQDAIGDDSLWSAVACVIYTCILPDGQVTPANMACINTNLCALTYVHSDVITAICNFVSQAGTDAWLQAQQPGVLTLYSCTCGTTPPTVVGPPILPPSRSSGTARVLIAAGQALGTLFVTYGFPFLETPTVVPTTDDPVMIPAVTGAGPTGFTLNVEASRPVTVDTTVDVPWVALPPGQS